MVGWIRPSSERKADIAFRLHIQERRRYDGKSEDGIKWFRKAFLYHQRGVAIQHTEYGTPQHIAHQAILIRLSVMMCVGGRVAMGIDRAVVQMNHRHRYLVVMMMRHNAVGQYHHTRQQHHHDGYGASHLNCKAIIFSIN